MHAEVLEDEATWNTAFLFIVNEEVLKKNKSIPNSIKGILVGETH